MKQMFHYFCSYCYHFNTKVFHLYGMNDVMIFLSRVDSRIKCAVCGSINDMDCDVAEYADIAGKGN